MQQLREEIERRKYLEQKVKSYVSSLVAQNNKLKHTIALVQRETECDRPDINKLRQIVLEDECEEEEGSDD